MTENANLTNWLLGLAGGIVGGVLGYFIFFFLARQGLYAIVVPGALVGLGCGGLSGFKSTGMGIVCALGAVLLGLFIEWQFAPFIRDESLAYFVSHVHELKSMTLALIAIGGVLSFWFGRGRDGGVWLRRQKRNDDD